MKVAVIIGGSGDIGRACAIRLADQHWSCTLVGRDEKRLNQVAQEVHNRGAEARIVPADSRIPLSFQTEIQRIAADNPIIHGLVNAAGVRGTPWDESDLETWNHTFDVNVNSSFMAIKGLQPCLMAAGSASIVNITSLAAKEGYAKVDYAASKAAADALTRSLAVILAPHGIRVNSIAPGPVEGKMTDAWSSERRQQMLEYIPLRRFGTPQEIAEIAAFLLGDQSSYINGSIVDVHGGLGCRFHP